MEFINYKALVPASSDSNGGRLQYVEDREGNQWILRRVYDWPLRADRQLSPAESYYKHWECCKEAGMFVAPHCQVLDDNALITTNVNVKGLFTFGKYMKIALRQSMFWQVPSHQSASETFLNMSSEYMESTMLQQVVLASNAGIMLPNDDPMEMAVNVLDNTVCPITFDFRDLDFTLDYQYAYQFNLRRLDFVLRQFEEIKPRLREFYSQRNNRPSPYYLDLNLY